MTVLPFTKYVCVVQLAQTMVVEAAIQIAMSAFFISDLQFLLVGVLVVLDFDAVDNQVH